MAVAAAVAALVPWHALPALYAQASPSPVSPLPVSPSLKAVSRGVTHTKIVEAGCPALGVGNSEPRVGLGGDVEGPDVGRGRDHARWGGRVTGGKGRRGACRARGGGACTRNIVIRGKGFNVR